MTKLQMQILRELVGYLMQKSREQESINKHNSDIFKDRAEAVQEAVDILDMDGSLEEAARGLRRADDKLQMILLERKRIITNKA